MIDSSTKRQFCKARVSGSTDLEAEINLYNEDCLQALKRMPDNYYDLAICDPPYGINLAEWDKETPKQEYFDEIRRVSVNQIIWGVFSKFINYLKDLDRKIFTNQSKMYSNKYRSRK